MKPHVSPTQRMLFKLLCQLQPARRSEGGYIIVVVAGMMIAISSMLLTAQLISRVDNNSTKASGNSAAGFYAAEAGLNLRAKAIRNRFEGYNVPSGTSPTDTAACRNGSGMGTSMGSGDFACDNSLTIQDYLYPNDTSKRIPVSTYVIDQNQQVNGVAQPTSITINPGELFAGLNAQEYRYDVISSAFAPTLTANQQIQPTAFLGIRFKSRLVPLFQFFAFYENDLDITRPAPLTINGPIHTNGSLYINAADEVSLQGQLSSVGRMFRGEKNPDETCNHNSNGWPGRLRINNSAGTALEMPCNGSPRGEITQDPNNANRILVGGTYVNDWGGQIRPRITRLTLPSSSFTDAKLPDSTSNYDYWNKADLRIALRLNNSDETPISIEVVNANRTTNASATAILNSSTCLPTSTTLVVGASHSPTVAYNATANPTERSTEITVANATNFNPGDVLRITRSSDGINDFDENVVLSKNGNRLTLARPLGRQAINVASGTVTVQRAIVWTSKTFFNYREKTLDSPTKTLAQQGRLIRMLNADMGGLMNCASALMGKPLNDDTDGGLVWHFTVLGPNSDVDVTKTPPDSPNSYGVRIYNGATLGSSAGTPIIRGLTFVSDQAVYVRGDYNTNNKRPAAILADSLNVLSNSSPLNDLYTCTGYNTFYNARDCTTTTALANRPASSTTINAAFLAGVDIPGDASGQGSGGLNNYPRLHENWISGPVFTYRGSMVSLGRARRVNGRFGQVGATWNIYSAPTRQWSYDTDFNNAANLPPLSPRFVYLRQERFSRDYNRTSFVPRLLPFGSLIPTHFVSFLPISSGSLFRF